MLTHHFEGKLTARDSKHCIQHPFVVPEGCGAVDIDFSFTPHRAGDLKNLLTLTLFDVDGFRGAGHHSGDRHRVHLDVSDATPGYLPGPLPAGGWVVEIDTHRIMPGEPVQYRLDVMLVEGVAADTAPVQPARPAAKPDRGSGWYRGDLHTHSHHSDAHNCTVAQRVQLARERGLDFVFLTDHNTTAGLVEMDASSAPDLLAAGGVELTTFWGHALCLGAREWVDWRFDPGSGEMARVAEATYARNQLFVIAHPLADGDPACTGCAWRFGEMMPGTARLVEVWNGPWGCDSNNERTLALWYDWLNQGLRLVATAGTDSHSARGYDPACGFNVVYAEALTERALLDALRVGHAYISAGPKVEFEARNESSARWMVGDTVAEPVTFRVAWDDCPADAMLRVIVNGRLLATQKTGIRGELAWSMSPEDADWVVIEVRDADGGMLAVTNPIFFDDRRRVTGGRSGDSD